jgi:hypothetical protein
MIRSREEAAVLHEGRIERMGRHQRHAVCLCGISGHVFGLVERDYAAGRRNIRRLQGAVNDRKQIFGLVVRAPVDERQRIGGAFIAEVPRP